MRQDIFDLLLLGACLYAFIRGGEPERLVAVLLAAGDLLSVLAVSDRAHRFHQEEVGILVIDALMSIMLVWIAIRSTRWWPLVLASFQLDALGCHLVPLILLDTMPVAYLNALAIWSWAMVLGLIAGTWRHRQRIAFYGEDPPWKARG